ncbi:MAG: VCBS repeat-containing protein [Flavobacteriales bacterium]|jgi:hypothetical protein|nr:VCBS repeat-containing protein [Flavobacteriales bacterium]
MKRKTISLLVGLFIGGFSIAQTPEFTRVLPPGQTAFENFTDVRYGTTNFTDIDGDNDQDVLITGWSNIGQISELYSNDGNGVFTKVSNTPFTGVRHSSVSFADIDGDNDQDVLITGNNSNNQPISELYTNDGSGVFTKVNNTSFTGVYHSSVSFTDIDGDNDQDVLITGSNNSNVRISELYTNDGNGVFTKVNNTPFISVNVGSVSFVDIDGDNDPDVLITGYSNVGRISELYTNDGNGVFTKVNNTPFAGVGNSSVSFADIDGDNDQDVLIAGISAGGVISELYTNDGNGVFTKVNNTPFTGVFNGSISFADIDGDNDQDVLITGRLDYSNAERISELYSNNGSGEFSKVSNTPFTVVTQSSVSFADIDGDNDQDILITGWSIIGRISELYTNGGNGVFVKVSNKSFTGVNGSSVSFADIDGDNDQDVLITGSSNGERISELYTNDGNGVFAKVNNTPFTGVSSGSVSFADIDGDYDQDVLITGYNSNNQGISEFYTNDGNGVFTKSDSTTFTDVYIGSVSFTDIDGDNDQDVLITGYNSNNQGISELYTNDGNGVFTKVNNTPFTGVSSGSVSFADIDGDDDPDVLITGYSQAGLISELYTNNGNGVFTKSESTPFTDVSGGSVSFADIDGDNDQDVLITGYSNGGPISELYENNGFGEFTKSDSTTFTGVNFSSVSFADIDGDNDQDVLITGYGNGGQVNELYTNDGNGLFAKVDDTPFTGVYIGSVSFADIDGDNDQDVLITGYSNDGSVAELWRNGSATTPSFTCPDSVIFCNSSSYSSFYEYISQVDLGSSSNASSQDYLGFHNYKEDATKHITGSVGQSLPLEIQESGYYANYFLTAYQVYIDWNQDGTYGDAGELAFYGKSYNGVTGNIQIPVSTLPGCYGVRVIASWANYTLPCYNFYYGEVEDYKLNVEAGNGNIPKLMGPQQQLEVAYTEFDNELVTLGNTVLKSGETFEALLRTKETGITTFQITDALGREHKTLDFAHEKGINEVEITTEGLPKGVFFIGNSLSVKALRFVIQ